jgi:flagellar motor component MotA
VSLSHVGRDRYDRYRRMARLAGHYSLLLGGAGTLIGVIVLLNHLGDPAEIASSIATSLISFFYGLLLKMVVFDPYTKSLEEFGDT